MAGKHLKVQPLPAKGNRGPVGGQPVGEPDAGNLHVRFDEGETWKRSMVELVKPRLTKGPTDRLDLNHRATSLLYREAREGWGCATQRIFVHFFSLLLAPEF